MHSQLVVLGGGPGGYAAAFIAADEGLEVTLVEQDPRLGRHVPAARLHSVEGAPARGARDERSRGTGATGACSSVAPKFSSTRFVRRKQQVIETMSGGLTATGQAPQRPRPPRPRHAARFVDAGIWRVTMPACPTTAADVRPPDPGHRLDWPSVPDLCRSIPRVMDSTGALELTDIPGSLLVIGGGYIGLEMGTVYAHLGSKVSVVELTDGLLPGADRDLVRPLHKRLKQLTADRIYLNTHGRVRWASAATRSKWPLKDRASTASNGTTACWSPSAGGRTAAIWAWKTPRSSWIDEDSWSATRSNARPIRRSWRSATWRANRCWPTRRSHEAKVAVEVLLGKPADVRTGGDSGGRLHRPGNRLGRLDRRRGQAEKRIPTKSAVYPWAASGRAQALGRTEGLTKWLVDPETERVLGCGIVGPGAGELIAEAVLAIEMGCVVRDLTESIHPHPTLSETLMNAGEVFFGTAVEIYKPRRRKWPSPREAVQFLS